MAKKEVPAYNERDFFRDLKAGKLYACYCLEGEEEFVKEKALSDLRAAVLAGPMRELNETRLTDPEADEVIRAAETLPLMADRRLLIVKDSHLLGSGPKAGEEGQADDADKLGRYLSQLPDTTVIVFWVRGAADKRKRLYKALKDNVSSGRCVICSFERQSEDDLRKWIVRRCRENKVTISDETATRLVFRTGNSLTQIQSETEKLCDYVGPGGTADEEALDAVVTQNLEYKVFDLSRTVLSGDGAKAFRMLEALLQDGEDRVGLLSLLGNQCRQLLKVAALSRAGARETEIARTVGTPDFVVRQTQMLARRFSMEEMARMPQLCVQAEFEIKSGRIQAEGGLEKVMLEILAMGGRNGKMDRAAAGARR